MIKIAQEINLQMEQIYESYYLEPELLEKAFRGDD